MDRQLISEGARDDGVIVTRVVDASTSLEKVVLSNIKLRVNPLYGDIVALITNKPGIVCTQDDVRDRRAVGIAHAADVADAGAGSPVVCGVDGLAVGPRRDDHEIAGERLVIGPSER